MKRRELENLGFSSTELIGRLLKLCGAALNDGVSVDTLRVELRSLARTPQDFVDHALFGQIARELAAPVQPVAYEFRDDQGYAVWGDEIDDAAHAQMRNACRLPVTVSAALMPDAHVGYGLPIGGVLATQDAVIPYAVGVDIACRVKMTVFDLNPDLLRAEQRRFENVLERETLFGVGAGWRRARPEHSVMDEDWSITPVTRALQDKAWSQLGTSGSGNHFVEFGEVQFHERCRGIDVGRYVALVSHSGSRGSGAQVCGHYSAVARALHPNLPRELQHLAWLPLSGVGSEYWAAMELMGKYASANHAVIHDKIRRALGAAVLFEIENHHNFAWKEVHQGRELIVHRKGATPAGAGVLGYIPGSMSAPGFLIEGRGNPRSLDSASHGAGRRLSRTKAVETIRWSHVQRELHDRGVHLISAGLDEAPAAYKDIEKVMAAQAELVRVLARFQPRIVKMAPAGERPED